MLDRKMITNADQLASSVKPDFGIQLRARFYVDEETSWNGSQSH
jgi:hypothetical protein